MNYSTLSEWMKPRAATLIGVLWTLGIKVTIYSTRRSLTQQKELYRLGHTRTLKSKHLTGDAMDLILDPPCYELAGQIWTHLGGKWGGHFNDPELARLERQHFEKPPWPLSLPGQLAQVGQANTCAHPPTPSKEHQCVDHQHETPLALSKNAHAKPQR